MRVHRPDEFYARLGRDGLIGFGESYLTGAWDADDLAGFLTVLAARMATLVPEPLQKLRALVTPPPPGHQRSTEDNSQANIAHHYDLSNDALRAVPRRDAELLLRAVRHLLVDRTRRPDHLVATAGGADGRDPASTARLRRRRPARSSGCSTRPASPRAPGSSRSAPAGASWRSAPPVAARPSTRSPCRSSSTSSPSSGSPRPASPTGSRSSCCDYRALGADGRRTTPSSRSR